ncbi:MULTISPECIES: hypothetical protein [unclassified Mesorhizobium]|uniref:hypothetical protein n=1 Tax=unclassified Mesorhizobium TaxID=325217 RepID=UPI001093F4F1|nr:MULTISPECIES: hypothetical protein [unclassified Mesorhizobium]TGT87045.1 hypothetical protein EN804_18210 [Mesorhizobium sp. M8A.F.Ca.ET.161.01.1.1]TGV40910.1 hypothetical protein EN785_18195 [Mesorhizobium sp. M8A.F.Ca.ET.142.01.1.1]TIT67605.1 MAG: hypothetical protein E5W90_06830 [Mesorhizobium sp.]
MKTAAKQRGPLRNILSGIAAAIATNAGRASEQGTGTASMVAEWPLPPSATLGSSMRLKGIEREVRARLPWTVRKFAKAETGRIVLRMVQADADAFRAASATIARTLEGIEALAVLPREAEDILTISSRERHKWLRDGRLKSIGTRTVKMRGRSKAVTFHVFDPRHIEDVLDRDLATAWREEDAKEASENRRRAAGKAALTRAGKRSGNARKTRNSGSDDAPKLEGWDTFEAEGLLH